MATFRILVLVSKTEIRSREFSFSSRSLRVKKVNLDLVSMPEIGGIFFMVSSRSLRVSVRNSRSRLDKRDWIRETLILVSRLKKRLSLTTDWYLSKATATTLYTLPAKRFIWIYSTFYKKKVTVKHRKKMSLQPLFCFYGLHIILTEWFWF